MSAIRDVRARAPLAAELEDGTRRDGGREEHGEQASVGGRAEETSASVLTPRVLQRMFSNVHVKVRLRSFLSTLIWNLSSSQLVESGQGRGHV